MTARRVSGSGCDETGEERDVGEEGDCDSRQGGEGERVEKDEAENGSLLAVGLRGSAGDDDAGSGDHLAHDAAGGVG